MKKIKSIFISFILIILSSSLAFSANLNIFSDLASKQEPVKEEKKKYEWESEEEKSQTGEQQEQKKKYEWEGKEDEKKVDPKMIYFKDKYEISFQKPFEVVWNAVKEAIGQCNCMIDRESYKQTDEGLYQGRIRSDICIIYDGRDSADVYLKRYSVKMPFIAGAVWDNARYQYRFIVDELPEGSVIVKLKGEISGFEGYITSHVHFWDIAKGEISTGYIEAKMLERIAAIVNK